MRKRFFGENNVFENQILLLYIFPVYPHWHDLHDNFMWNWSFIKIGILWGLFISFVCTTFDTIFWIILCWNDSPKKLFVFYFFKFFFWVTPLIRYLEQLFVKTITERKQLFLNSKFYFSETFPVLPHWNDLQDDLMWKR